MDEDYYPNGDPILSNYELGVAFGLIEPDEDDDQ